MPCNSHFRAPEKPICNNHVQAPRTSTRSTHSRDLHACKEPAGQATPFNNSDSVGMCVLGCKPIIKASGRKSASCTNRGGSLACHLGRLLERTCWEYVGCVTGLGALICCLLTK